MEIATTREKSLEDLQLDHSEMLASAHDLGMEVPEDLELTFETAETGAAVCASLHKLITDFRRGLDAADEGAADATPSAPKKTRAKRTKKSAPSEDSAQQPAPEPASEEKSDMTTTAKKTATKQPKSGAKKAPAKKTTARRAPKKAAPAKKAKKTAHAPKRAGDDTRIVVLNKANPFREGTDRHGWAKTVLTSKTLGEAKANGAISYIVRRLVAMKHIKLEKPRAD